jgi:hypothetical protein
VLATLIFIFLIASLLINNDAKNDANNQTIPTTGTIYVSGLEIYGGDIKSESGKNYIDWGELSVGASKNVSFYVQTTSNVDVILGLNVTGWAPAGIEDYISISWSYNGTLLSSDQEPLWVTVNLDVSSSGEFISYLVANNVTAFSFDMTIYTSGL